MKNAHIRYLPFGLKGIQLTFFKSIIMTRQNLEREQKCGGSRNWLGIFRGSQISIPFFSFKGLFFWCRKSSQIKHVKPILTEEPCYNLSWFQEISQIIAIPLFEDVISQNQSQQWLTGKNLGWVAISLLPLNYPANIWSQFLKLARNKRVYTPSSSKN